MDEDVFNALEARREVPSGGPFAFSRHRHRFRGLLQDSKIINHSDPIFGIRGNGELKSPLTEQHSGQAGQWGS
jgi:hypothetical protein